MMNILNGGKHADNNVDFQEFMIQPWGFDSFSEGLRAGVEIYHSLKKVLHKNKMSTAVGDEGGFAPDLKDNEDALKVIGEAVTAAGYEFGKQVFVALDPAASELWDNGQEGLQVLQVQSRQDPHRPKRWSITGPSGSRNIRSARSKMVLAENDWDGWKLMTDRVGKKVQLVGDDLFVTNVKFLEKGIKTGTANSILVKVNQIGTLSETFAAVNMAIRNGYTRGALASQRRNRRLDDRRHRGRDELRPDQDRRPGPIGSRRQVQPVAPHRRAARRSRGVWWIAVEQGMRMLVRLKFAL